MQYVNALSPPIAGERVGVEGWGQMGTYWRPTVPNPHASLPQSTMCSFLDLRRYAVAAAAAVAVAGRGKLKNVK